MREDAALQTDHIEANLLSVLLVRKSKIHPTLFESNPKHSASFCTSRWGCIVLQADEESTKNMVFTTL